MATTKLVTVEEVWEMGEDARVELIEGVLHEVAVAGGRHGGVAGRFAGHLFNYGERTGSDMSIRRRRGS